MQQRSTEDRPEELRRLAMNGMGLSLGVANVIMQLSRLPIGHGVAESKVESGSLHAHPLKRFRTTIAYIAVALYGTDGERAAMAREVGRQHRLVRSSPGDPVAYNAFDPELQLWVAACMYRGLVDAVRLFQGEPSEHELDVLYRASARFATTLQVPPERWPADRVAFDRYFTAELERIETDEVTRTFLLGLASLDFLPRWVARWLGPAHRFLTIGFLPPAFRDVLGLSWSDRQDRRFRVVIRCARALWRRVPRFAKELPFNWVLFDTRRRIRTGRAIV